MSPRAPVNFLKSPLPIILFISILFFAFSSFLPSLSQALAATYYVDATNSNDANTGLSEATPWKTIAKVNASSFVPGDQILFKRGEIWREQLTVPSSGSSGNPITIGAYGSGELPVINGSNLISSGWTQYRSTVWQAAVTTRPNQIFFNGVRGTPVASVAAINGASKWYWASNILYVYSTSAPATAFTNPGIEASQRQYNISGNGKSYVTIQNLNLQNSNGYGFAFNGVASNVTIDGCTVGHSYYSGIAINGNFEVQSVIIRNSTVNWNGANGISIYGPGHDWTVEDNVVHNNSQNGTNDGGMFTYSGGIRACCDSSVKKIIVQRNKVYSQGKLPDGTRVTSSNGDPSDNARAQGIWMDTLHHTNYTDGPLIIGNEVYDNQHDGILIENGSYNTVIYNLVYNNNATEAWGIRVSDWHAQSPANYNRVYNNVVYSNSNGGINISGSFGSEANRCIGNEVKNNIVIGNGSGSNLVANNGGENDGTMGNGNVYTYNSFGPQGTNFIQWGNGVYKSTYAAWYSAYSAANGNTVESDPLFVSTSTPDFHLQSTSPAINAGTNVAVTSDYEGNHVPFGPAPDVGAYEYHSGFLKPQPPTGLRVVP
jgi:parallel beta-helix repeat protein